MTLVTFSNTKAAVAFCRFAAPKGFLAGAHCWDGHRWRDAAMKLAKRMRPDDAARALIMVKAKGARFHGAYCRQCNAPLSAPESVLAGIGPECMKAKAA